MIAAIHSQMCSHCGTALSVSLVGTPACLRCRKSAHLDAVAAMSRWRAQRPQISPAPIDAGPMGVEQMGGAA